MKEDDRKYSVVKKLGPWTIVDRTLIKNPGLRRYHPCYITLSNLITQGFMLDTESWYSITPEYVTLMVINLVKRAIVNNLAYNRTVLCGYCGVGGDALVFAKNEFNVICNDISYKKIKYLKHNYKILNSNYSNIGSISFIVEDFFNVSAKTLNNKPFLAFISPPWGGQSYKKQLKYNLKEMNLHDIHQKAKEFAENIVYFLPKNCNYAEIKKTLEYCKIKAAKKKNKESGLIVYYGPIFN